MCSTKTWWIVKLFSMLISSKHSGTGSFNKNKKNLRKKKNLLWEYLLLQFSFLSENLGEDERPIKQCSAIGWSLFCRLITSNLWIKSGLSIWKVLSSYITVDTNGQLQLMSQMMTPSQICFAHHCIRVLVWDSQLCKHPGADRSVTKVKTNSLSAWK